jgi:flagellar L-ring protein precursor FlgH
MTLWRNWSYRAGRLVALGALLLLSACSSIPDSMKPWQDPPEVEPPAPVVMPPPIANGSVYQERRGFAPLFEDRRPRRMGDILTIVLNEEVSASKNAASTTARSSNASLALDQLPDALDTLADYGFDLSGESNFDGGGGSSANNTFTGTITVTVQDVLPNGNLRVIGEKRITINHGTEFIRFSGTVQPRTVSVRNTVASTEVADARIEYTGNGYIDEAQRMGWLQRFFLTVSPL